MKRLSLLPTLITMALSGCGHGASSSPPAAVAPKAGSAAAPKAGSPALDDLLREDLTADSAFPWTAARRLRWRDFRGQPPRAGEEGAKTAYALFYAWKCRGEAFEFSAVAAFRPRQSWVKTVILNDTAQSRSALGHEQTHFDLTEVYARRMRQYFTALPDACRKTDPELTALAQKLLREEKAEQQRYDAETEHGLRAAQQATWSRDVARRLRGG
ncbi:MAG TPA: DUF922 domain-containing protein [Gemmatimonadales bacterium]|nr:DUF922 domain-containing protein [Gemmatimonadales bacterium]